MFLRLAVPGIFLCALAAGADIDVAAPRPAQTTARKLWWSGVATLTAASALDVGSSWGKLELNPLLRGPDGRFGARGLEIKAALVGTGCLLQWLVLRHHPHLEKPFGAIDIGVAGAFTAAAVHNLR